MKRSIQGAFLFLCYQYDFILKIICLSSLYFILFLIFIEICSTVVFPINAFKSKISKELYEKLTEMVRSREVVRKVTFHKMFFNRARPMQVAPEKINAPKSKTANTPSYPSGHAYQSYYAAKVLSRLEPARKKEWDEIAERAAYIRVYMGIHYPSDVRYAKLLVDELEIEYI